LSLQWSTRSRIVLPTNKGARAVSQRRNSSLETLFFPAQINIGGITMPEKFPEGLFPQFGFRPWPPGDPVAPWPWLVDQIDPRTVIQLATISLELNKAILDAQVKAIVQAQEIVKSLKK
jgi:hypothetical protein